MGDNPKMKDVFTSGPKIGHKRRPGKESDPDEIFIAPQGYKAYHGTSEENVAEILKYGLDPRRHDSGRDDEMVTNCFTEDSDVCEDYGDVTIEADLSGMKIRRFWDQGDEGGVWEVQVDEPIPPSRLRRVR